MKKELRQQLGKKTYILTTYMIDDINLISKINKLAKNLGIIYIQFKIIFSSLIILELPQINYKLSIKYNKAWDQRFKPFYIKILLFQKIDLLFLRLLFHILENFWYIVMALCWQVGKWKISWAELKDIQLTVTFLQYNFKIDYRPKSKNLANVLSQPFANVLANKKLVKQNRKILDKLQHFLSKIMILYFLVNYQQVIQEILCDEKYYSWEH